MAAGPIGRMQGAVNSMARQAAQNTAAAAAQRVRNESKGMGMDVLGQMGIDVPQGEVPNGADEALKAGQTKNGEVWDAEQIKQEEKEKWRKLKEEIDAVVDQARQKRVQVEQDRVRAAQEEEEQARLAAEQQQRQPVVAHTRKKSGPQGPGGPPQGGQKKGELQKNKS